MFCNHCGQKIEDGSKFCEHCGAKVEPFTPNAPQQPARPEVERPIQQTQRASVPSVNPADAVTPRRPAPANRPTGGYAPAPMGGMPTQEPKKPKSKTPIFILIIGLLVAAIAVLTILLLTNSSDESKEEATPTEAATTVPEETEVPTEAPTEAPNYQEIAAYYSTDAYPNLETFSWFTDTGFGAQTPPILVDATPITTTELVEGGWQMITVWDPDRIYNAYCWDLDNAVITTVGTNVTVTVNQFMFYEPDEGYTSDKIGQAPAVYSGTWNGMTANVAATGEPMTLNAFYEKDGRQYALGNVTAPDGTEGRIALMRP